MRTRAVAVATALLAAPAPGAAAHAAARPNAVGPAPGSQRLELVFPLRARLGGLHELAAAVATPGSSQYAHYEPLGALSRRFGASSSVRRRVVGYLRGAGATDIKIDATGLFADATITARRAQRLFGSPLARIHGPRQPQFIAPTRQVTVPPALRGIVGGVVGLDTRPLANAAPPVSHRAAANPRAHAAAQPTSAFPRTGTPSGCPAGVTAGAVGGDPRTAGFTPNQYLAAYGFDQLHQAGVSGQGERVALIEIDGFKSADIDTFAQCFGLSVPPVTAYSVGVHHPLMPGGESTLDLEALDAAAPGLKAIDVYETNANAADTLKSLTAPLQNRGRFPQVISASLGLCEPAVYGAVGIRGIVATEAALEMAAVSGVTLLASSGDSGSADCIAPNGFPIDRLAVNYPASSAVVTAVGGTNLLLDPANHISSQVVWNDTNVQPGSAAGGGSSQLFRRPVYQRGAVGSRFRAIPDVSMLADIIPGYAVYCSAERDCVDSHHPDPWQSVGGTSAATPLLAGGFALVDQELRAHQRQGLGFVNPLLYEIGRRSSLRTQVFNDVLSYGNDVGPYIPGDGRPLGCCSASAAYDRASGWGSIDLASLAPVALSLQPGRIALSIPPRQRPIAHRKLQARISCTAACRMGAYATVKIGRKLAFAADSRVYRITSAASKTIPIKFSAKQLRRLRAALARHRRISATVFGVLITGARTVEFQTRGRRLKITS